MTHRSAPAADTRAASAALPRLQTPIDNFDRYLLIDDSDEDVTEISLFLRESSRNGGAAMKHMHAHPRSRSFENFAA